MEDKNEGASEFKPGATIHPGDAPVTPAAPSPPQVVAPATTPVAAPAPTPEPTAAATPADEPPQAVAADFESPVETADVEADSAEQINWTASEFIDHDKSFDWYLGLAVVAVLCAVALYVFFRDIITSITPLVAALALGFYGRRRPRQLEYRLDSQGISIAEKFLPYSLFRSFAVMDEGPFVSIALLPMKRFGLLTTLYHDPKDEDRIIDLLNQFLPFEPREHDAVDRLMKRIRF